MFSASLARPHMWQVLQLMHCQGRLKTLRVSSSVNSMQMGLTVLGHRLHRKMMLVIGSLLGEVRPPFLGEDGGGGGGVAWPWHGMGLRQTMQVFSAFTAERTPPVSSPGAPGEVSEEALDTRLFRDG